MKKVILILLIIISCMGCTYEGPHYGCDRGSLNLVFTYEGNTDNFDLSVASDIELYLYNSEGNKIEMRHIPYNDIKGGQPYSFELQYTGTTYLVAWTLSGDKDIDKEPLMFLNEENYSEIRFAMSKKTMRQSQMYNGSAQDLFWKNLIFDSNPLEEKNVNVEVKKLLCNITVTIEEGNSFKIQYPGELRVNIWGSSDSYHVSENQQSGDGIVIEDKFSYIESRDEYVSENKVLPASIDSESGEEDNIVVTLFEDGIARLRVDTEAKAREGSQIDIVIRPTKQEAIITVDSWQIRKALVML
ncbi:FimB/Mfa2 family fimbrial subunit [Coprobacter fastidiosus]|nr:FimB/Mfa2 family fimbrial subunit [Coprobacter fastidiosus]